MNWTKIWIALCALLAWQLVSSCGHAPVAPRAERPMGWHYVSGIQENTPGAPRILRLRAVEVVDAELGRCIDVTGKIAANGPGGIPTPDSWCAQVFIDTDLNGTPNFLAVARCVEPAPYGMAVRSYFPHVPENPGGWGNLTGLAQYGWSATGSVHFRVPYSALHQPWEPNTFSPPAVVELWLASWDQDGVGSEMSMARATLAGPGMGRGSVGVE